MIRPGQKQSGAADVCLVLEGTYPYISGGVSTWVHQIITAMPDLKFALFYVGAQHDAEAALRYEIPENVIGFEEVYLFDELPKADRVPTKIGSRARAERPSCTSPSMRCSPTSGPGPSAKQSCSSSPQRLPRPSWPPAPAGATRCWPRSQRASICRSLPTASDRAGRRVERGAAAPPLPVRMTEKRVHPTCRA